MILRRVGALVIVASASLALAGCFAVTSDDVHPAASASTAGVASRVPEPRTPAPSPAEPMIPARAPGELARATLHGGREEFTTFDTPTPGVEYAVEAKCYAREGVQSDVGYEVRTADDAYSFVTAGTVGCDESGVYNVWTVREPTLLEIALTDTGDATTAYARIVPLP